MEGQKNLQPKIHVHEVLTINPTSLRLLESVMYILYITHCVLGSICTYICSAQSGNVAHNLGICEICRLRSTN